MLYKIAIKNLLGAKLRTWLNVFVTSISFFMIIFISGMYDGMREYAKQTSIDTEIAGGAYWHPRYDPMDPMTYEDAHSVPPVEVSNLVAQGKAFSVIVSQATIYPEGRMVPVVMKGIIPNQKIVNLPIVGFCRNLLCHFESNVVRQYLTMHDQTPNHYILDQ